MPGTLKEIHIAPVAAAPMESVAAATLVSGRGIEGDRYGENKGAFSPTPLDHELTLIEAEVLAQVAAEHGVTLAPGETRRNLTVEGIRLNPLVGKRFSIGGILCEGTRTCEPCAYLERQTGKGGLARILAGRGGLRARILTGGVIRIGDTIAEEGVSDDANERSEMV